jgi:hypothetical protein
MNEDLIFEKEMKKLLNRLDEVDGQNNNPDNQNTTNQAGAALPPGQDTSQQDNQTEPYPGDKKFSYLPTPTLFTTYYGPDADKWPQSPKKMYDPLRDGRVGGQLIRFIERNSKDKDRTRIEHIGDSMGVSKSSDYQFRIRMPARLKFETRLRVDVGDDDARIRLERIEITSPFNLHNKGKFSRKDSAWLANIKPIELKNVDTERMMQWEKEVSDEEASEARKWARYIYRGVSEADISGTEKFSKDEVRKQARKIVQIVSNALGGENIPQSLGRIHKVGNFNVENVIEAAKKSLADGVTDKEKLTKWIGENSYDIFGTDLSIIDDLPKVMHMGAAEDAEKGEEEAEGEPEGEEVTDTAAYNIANVWVNQSDPSYTGISKKEASKFAKWVAEEYPERFSEEHKDADVDEIMKQYTSTLIELVKEYNKKQESYTINLNDYLRSLLTEKKKKKKSPRPKGQAIEQELGGEILGELNKKLFDRWFGVPRGITAKSGKPKFEGKLYEFFAADSAKFVPQERKNIPEEETEEFKFSFYLDGFIRATGHIWIDARIGEGGGIDKWTFRVHDNPNKPFFTASFTGTKKVTATRRTKLTKTGAAKGSYPQEVQRPDKGNPADTGQTGAQGGQQ